MLIIKAPREILQTQELYDDHWVPNELWAAELAAREDERKRFVPIPDALP